MSAENKKGSPLEGITKTQDLYSNNKNNNFEFINSLYREGNLHFDSNGSMWKHLQNRPEQECDRYIIDHTKPAIEPTFTHFRSMIKTLQEVYPDMWNLELFYNQTYKKVVLVGFTIHYPRMTISNRTGAKHLLRDIYAFTPLKMSGNFLLPNGLYSSRLTVTMGEKDANYWHSHCPGTKEDSFQEFSTFRTNHLQSTYLNMCLGDSSQGITNSQSIFRRDPSTDNFISCLLHIRSTLMYESLEGGPHRHFSNIETSGNSNRAPQPYNRSVSNSNIDAMGKFLLKFALKEDPNLLLKFDLKYHPFLNKSLIFQDDLKLKEVLDNSFRKLISITPNPSSKIVIERSSTGNVQSYSIEELSKLFYHRTNNGNKKVDTNRFYLPEPTGNSTQQTEDVVTYSGKSPLMFRGELRTYKIVRPAGNNVDEYTKLYPTDTNIYLDDAYFQQIKQTLISKLTKNVFIQEKEISEIKS